MTTVIGSSRASCDVRLVVRFCSSAAFDAESVIPALLENAGVGYADLRGVYSALFQKVYHKSPGWEHARVINAGLDAYLETQERQSELLLLGVIITHFRTFFLLLQALKERYPRLSVIIVTEHPLPFYNAFSLSRPDARFWPAFRRYFLEEHLYRLDSLIAVAERCCGRENVRVLAADGKNDDRELIRRFYELLHLNAPESLLALPVPQTSESMDLNRLRAWPTVTEILPLPLWREALRQWERGDAPENVPERQELERVLRGMQNCWTGIARRHPELERVQSLDIEAFLNRARYAGLREQRIRQFGGLLPADMRAELLSRLAALRPLWNRQVALFCRTLSPEDATEIEVKPQPRCTVLTMSFNQKNYIGECIESVARQRLDCGLEHIIVDDASTDGTQDIIRSYARRYSHIRPVLFGKKPPTTIGTAMNLCRSEYVALCDGDDFFTDENKLRLQMDFLDRHRECALCFHRAEIRYEDGRPSRLYPDAAELPAGEKDFYAIEDLLVRNFMQTSSVMYRWRFREGLPRWFRPNLVPGDWYWHLLHAETGSIGFLRPVMSCYRRHADAVYMSAEGDMRAHRRRYGMRELSLYEELNRHFRGKYRRYFESLAVGVFSNFTEDAVRGEDAAFLTRAIALFPDFAAAFQKRLTDIYRGTHAPLPPQQGYTHE